MDQGGLYELLLFPRDRFMAYYFLLMACLFKRCYSCIRGKQFGSKMKPRGQSVSLI